MHTRVAERVRSFRNDTIPLDGEDVAGSFKFLKLGLRVVDLMSDWASFAEKYQRIYNTFEDLFNIRLDPKDVNRDLDDLKQLHSVLKDHKMIADTVSLINKDLGKKRFLVEDCSSSTMDVDTGIYPYTDSFHTTTGQVSIGLGVPEEAIETTLGVFSATSIIKKWFLNRIRQFPTQILEDDPAYEDLQRNLEQKYQKGSEEKFAFGWLDLNSVRWAHTINQLSGLFLTELDVLDSVDEVKICTNYLDGNKKVEGVLPAFIKDFERMKPEYRKVTGWKEDITGVEKFDDLPGNAKEVVR